MDVVYTVGPRRYVVPLVVTALVIVSKNAASVLPNKISDREVSVLVVKSAVKDISARNLTPITDETGTAFDDGEGGTFHIY